MNEQNTQPLCATCRKWALVPKENQPDVSGKLVFGHCRARPPRVHFLPMPAASAKETLLKLTKPGAGSSPMQLTPVNVFPATESREWCAEHVATLAQSDPLIYDPDRYNVNHGFNRPPTLAEAKVFAANQSDIIAAAQRVAQAQAVDDNVPDLGPQTAPGS